MKKINIIAVILLAVLLLSSCEETVTGVTLPYNELLVIRALLKPNELIGDIKVEKTLPPLERYNSEKALIQDATLIISDGEEKDTLYFKQGRYYSRKMVAQSGKTYYLTAKWKGKTATAHTIVPHKADFDKVEFKIEREISYGYVYYYVDFYTRITPDPNLVYQGATVDRNDQQYYYDSELKRYSQAEDDGKLNILFTRLYLENRLDDKLDSAYIWQFAKSTTFSVISYDKQFYEYFYTRYNGMESSGIFGGAPDNVMWNIEGDGIGMFIGLSYHDKKF